MESPDILLDENENILSSDSGDFSIGDASNAHIKSIVVAYPGHWKEFPEIGVGAESLLNSNTNIQVVERLIRVQLENDVFKNPGIDLSSWPPLIAIDAVEIDLGDNGN